MNGNKFTREMWHAVLDLIQGCYQTHLCNKKTTIFGNFELISEVEGRFNSPYLYWGESKRPISIATGLLESLQRRKKTDVNEQTFSSTWAKIGKIWKLTSITNAKKQKKETSTNLVGNSFKAKKFAKGTTSTVIEFFDLIVRFNFCREHFNQKNIFLEKHQLYRYLISVQSVLRFAPSKNDTSCSVAGGMSGFINNNSYKILSEHKTFLVLLLWGLGKASIKNVFFNKKCFLSGIARIT